MFIQRFGYTNVDRIVGASENVHEEHPQRSNTSDKRKKPFDSLTLAQDHSTRAGFMFGTLITSRVAARSVVMSEA